MKSNRNTIVALFGCLLGIVVLLYSCDSSTYEEASGYVPNPTYTKNIKPIMDNNCTSCHNGVQEISLLTYEEVKGNIVSGNLLCRINNQCGDVMPPTGKMNSGKIRMIQTWKDNNFPQN